MLMVMNYRLSGQINPFVVFSSHEGLLTVDEGLGLVSKLLFVFHGRKHEAGKYAESASIPFLLPQGRSVLRRKESRRG